MTDKQRLNQMQRTLDHLRSQPQDPDVEEALNQMQVALSNVLTFLARKK